MSWKNFSKKIFKKDDLLCWCRNSQYRILIENKSINSFSILKCLHCGLVRTFPVPDYSKERYLNYGTVSYIKNSKVLIAAMKNMLVQITKFKTRGRFLEIGSSVGYLLKLARDKGFEVSGVEPSREAVEIAEKSIGGGVVRNCSFAETDFPEKDFDIVAMNHVLEHIPDLSGALLKVKDILKDDGIIFIGTPNFNGLFRKITKKNWPGLRPNEHIWQFEPKTIKNILEMSGFRVLKIRKTFSKSLSSIISFPEGFLLKDFLMGMLNWFMGIIGFGDNTFIIATKNAK